MYIVKRCFNFTVWFALLISGMHVTKHKYKLTDCWSFKNEVERLKLKSGLERKS